MTSYGEQHHLCQQYLLVYFNTVYDFQWGQDSYFTQWIWWICEDILGWALASLIQAFFFVSTAEFNAGCVGCKVECTLISEWKARKRFLSFRRQHLLHPSPLHLLYDRGGNERFLPIRRPITRPGRPTKLSQSSQPTKLRRPSRPCQPCQPGQRKRPSNGDMMVFASLPGAIGSTGRWWPWLLPVLARRSQSMRCGSRERIIRVLRVREWGPQSWPRQQLFHNTTLSLHHF